MGQGVCRRKMLWSVRGTHRTGASPAGPVGATQASGGAATSGSTGQVDPRIARRGGTTSASASGSGSLDDASRRGTAAFATKNDLHGCEKWELAAVGEKRLDQRRGFLGQNPRRNRNAMIERGGVENLHAGANGAALGFIGAIN